MRSVCLPTQLWHSSDKDACPGLPACGGQELPISRRPPAPPHLGTYTGPLRQPRGQCPLPEVLGGSGFKEQQEQEAQSPADLSPATAHLAAGGVSSPDGQRRGVLWPVGPRRGAEVCSGCWRVSQLHSAGSLGSCVRAQPRPPPSSPGGGRPPGYF